MLCVDMIILDADTDRAEIAGATCDNLFRDDYSPTRSDTKIMAVELWILIMRNDQAAFSNKAKSPKKKDGR